MNVKKFKKAFYTNKDLHQYLRFIVHISSTQRKYVRKKKKKFFSNSYVHKTCIKWNKELSPHKKQEGYKHDFINTIFYANDFHKFNFMECTLL